MTGRRVLIVTNMWPAHEADYKGIFVQQQVEALRTAAPHWRFHVLEIAGPRGRVDYIAAVPRVRAALRDGYDAVHAHYGLTAATVALARPAAPLIVTLHGNDVNWGWQLRISRWGARRAARVITVSDQLRDRFGGASTRVLPCGVPVALFGAASKSEARRSLGLPTDATVVLFPAAPANPIKDYPLFEAALAALPVGIRERVTARALGEVAPRDVALEMAAADVVVLTSIAEGSPMVVKEALASGTPVVSVDVGDVAAVLDGVPGCAVTSRDARALARGIEGALASRRSAQEAEAAARRRARIGELGLADDAIARELLDIYEDAISSSSRRRRASVPSV